GKESDVGFPYVAELVYNSAKLNDLALDPPDPHFKTVVKVHTDKFLQIHANKAKGISPQLALAVNNLFKNDGLEEGVMDAITTTVTRADGADQAGKPRFEKLQLKALRGFRHQLAALVLKEIKLRFKASKLANAAGFSLAGKITSSDVFAMEQDVASNGLPA